jgi:integrase
VRRVHALIAVSLHQGQKWGLVVTNVADMASPPPVRTQEPTPPTWEQVVAIIKEAEAADPMFAELFTMAALTGARRGELCGLRWSDWDRDAGTVTIERSVYEVKGGGFGIKGTKSHGRRVVTLDATAVAALSRRWGVATDLTDSYGAVLDDDAYIFTVHPNGSEPIRPDVVTGRFTTAARAAGVDTHLHMLRHWAATEMIGAGVPVPVAAKRLGHKDSSVTLRIYSHALPAQDAEAAALLGSRLAGRKRLPA